MTTNSPYYGLMLENEDTMKHCLFTDDMKKICEYIANHFNDELKLQNWDKYIIINPQDFDGYVNWDGSDDDKIAEASDFGNATQEHREAVHNALVEMLC